VVLELLVVPVTQLLTIVAKRNLHRALILRFNLYPFQV